MCKGGKDILVCVHIRNILRARGCYRNVKVPSSPYKRGRECTCKRIQTFLELVLFAERITVSLRPNLVLEHVENFIRVRVVIRIFRVLPNTAPKAFSRAMRTSPHPFSLCFIGPGAFFAPLPEGPLLVVYVVTHAPASCLLPILNHK
jgi:hypothetical protein